MTRSLMRKKAIQALNRRGCLLVYPLANRREPGSIWSELFPRSRMRWEWDQDGDTRVSDLWRLREELSRSNQVVYAKWFQGRSTFFSLEVFTLLLAFLRSASVASALNGESREILEILFADSPQSTKQLKKASELEGRLLEPTYNRALRPLWQHLLIVGYGEFADSSFPSLGLGAASSLFESAWRESPSLSATVAEHRLRQILGEENPFFKYATKVSRTSAMSFG